MNLGRHPTLQRAFLWMWPAVPVLAALLFTSGLLIAFDTSPFVAFEAMYQGAFGDSAKQLSVLAFWVPLFLASSGLLITFRAGLWNIGIEGQIILGAVAASWVALKLDAPGPVLIIAELGAAMIAGALWAALAAVLKTRGRVHEIFGGLALNNLAIILTNYLISGPWQPPEGGTFRGTEPFQEAALLPLYGDSRFSPLSLVLALVAFALVVIALRGTFWGLKLKALGKNAYSSFLLGVSSEREIILAMMFCGALAGLGGSVRVLSWFDSLRQSISGGIGFLALLVVMLANFNMFLVPFIALFFSAVLGGSITLQLRTQLHSSLGGILTGVMVLFVLLFGDARKLGFGRPKEVPDESSGDGPEVDAPTSGAPEVGGQPLDPLGKDIPQGE
jgi:simple sugar transport system permease protein